MASNAQKTWFASDLNRFAERKVMEAISLTGKCLPCSIVKVDGSIVDVKFEVQTTLFTLPQVTIPVAYPEYIRVPFQVGDKGVAVPADVILGGINGLGSGVASLSLAANLSALFFVPIGNKNWAAPIDKDKIELYGKEGCIFHALNGNVTETIKKTTWELVAGNVKITVTKDADTVIDINGKKLVINNTTMTWDGDLDVKGGIRSGVGTGDQVTLQHHTHGGISTGGGNSSQPNAGT